MTDPKAGRKTRVLGDGRYVVRGKLGEGGMAVVYRAHDTRLDTDVVIKIPRPALLADKEFKERFRREIRSLVTLSHPHIVTIHDVGEHRSTPFVVMQYLSGGSLEDRRKALRTMKSWLPQICSALDFIHSRGYVHRDIKPGNILFDDNGNAYLSDFGIVKAMADAERSAHHDATLTRTGMVVGTPDYMAPEVIMGEAYDGRADQYSLAVMVHEMLAGEKPFAGPTTAAVMVKHTSDPPPSLTTINPQIRESMAHTVVRALAKDPDERFANCEEFWKALRSSSTGGDSGAVVPAAPSDWTESQSLTSEPTSTAHPSDADGRPLPLTGVRRQTGGAMGAILGVVRSVDAALERTAGQGNEAVHKFLRGAVVAFPCLLVLMVVLLWPRTPEQSDVALEELGGATSDATSSTGSEGNAVAEVSPEIGESSVDEESTGQSDSGNEPESEPKSEPVPQGGNTTSGEKTEPGIGLPDRMSPGASDEGKAEPPPLALAPFDVADAKQHQRAWAEYLGVPVETTNSIGMSFRLIPAGEFMMGSAKSAEEIVRLFHLDEDDARFHADEHPQHPIRITKPLYLGVHEVTVGQFRSFVDASGYRTEVEKDGRGGWGYDAKTRRLERHKPTWTWRNVGLTQTDDHPVVNVTWNDAVAFCRWLSDKEGVTCRLPTEAEWECACRAGTVTMYYHGDNSEGLTQIGNMADGTAQAKSSSWMTIAARAGSVLTTPVGQFRPNGFGLCDTHGNVWEWCQDWYAEDYYVASPTDDPSGPATGSLRVNRGGAWCYTPKSCRSAMRNGSAPEHCSINVGFRVVLVQPAAANQGSRRVGRLQEGLPTESASRHDRGEKGGAGTGSMETSRVPPGSIDLLGLIDLERDSVKGRWRLHQSTLIAPKTPGARVQIPYRAPSEYALTISAEPKDPKNGFVIGLTSGGRQFHAIIDFKSWGMGPMSALENVDGRDVAHNPARLNGDVLRTGRRSIIVCTVRRGDVTIHCDGKPIINWKGPSSRLSLNTYWEVPSKEALFIGTYACEYRIDQITLKAISGVGRTLADPRE